KGLKSIYLGQSIPIDNLSDLKNIYDKINFVTYFTVKPSTDKITNYINKLYDEIISLCNCNLWVMGRKAVELESFETSKNIDVITNIESFMKKINQLTKHKNKAS
ncbi:MAG: MerR family transcriptional regulator, partial [Flavobacteriaceae bacterium]|nr:MerR family transcriptional regulator [Flavobacteriaceae bacterium]